MDIRRKKCKIKKLFLSVAHTDARFRCSTVPVFCYAVEFFRPGFLPGNRFPASPVVRRAPYIPYSRKSDSERRSDRRYALGNVGRTRFIRMTASSRVRQLPIVTRK